MKINVKKLRPAARLTAFVFLVLLIPMQEIAKGDGFNNLPVKGMVTMIDLGAKKCIPCKMMAPILEKMEKVYRGKAAVVFIDVWEHREQAQRFRIRAIPTQIFYDKNGKEVYRHLGFMSEKAIVAQLETMGVK
jgi:thioredoxin 1